MTTREDRWRYPFALYDRNVFRSISVRELPNYAGMTVSERFRSADLTEQWVAAVLAGNRPRMLELLRTIDLEDKADWIIETVLANPQQYGF